MCPVPSARRQINSETAAQRCKDKDSIVHELAAFMDMHVVDVSTVHGKVLVRSSGTETPSQFGYWMQQSVDHGYEHI